MSNNEIVEIDWGMYKGTNNKNALNGYINFNNQLKLVGAKMLSPYTGKEDDIVVDLNGIIIETTPTRFRVKTVKSIIKFFEVIEKHTNHKFVKWYDFKKSSGGGLLVEIEVILGEKREIIQLPINAYNYSDKGFLKSEKETMDYIEQNDFDILTPYIGNKNKVLIDFKCGHLPSWLTPDNLKSGVGCRDCRDYNNSGENNNNWKGGITELSHLMRKRIISWKLSSLKENNYRCVLTNKKDNLAIHHLYPFSKILDETLDQLNLPIHKEIGAYTIEEIKAIEDMCLELHFKYGLGVTLTKEVHDEFHLIYGYGDNTQEQFEEFKIMKLSQKEVV